MPAERILDLTVCEPAMGSAAFLNEAVNQLSERYLERRQRELGQRIPHADYADELQKVRHYIADRNVYGVDLNPVAVELAEISLWLNCIHQNGHVPWFGFQLVVGNSLIGARRQVYPADRLRPARKADLWFSEAPERVQPAPNSEMWRPEGTVYHFLLPDPGMAGYRNKDAKALEPEHFARIASWRKEFCGVSTRGKSPRSNPFRTGLTHSGRSTLRNSSRTGHGPRIRSRRGNSGEGPPANPPTTSRRTGFVIPPSATPRVRIGG